MPIFFNRALLSHKPCWYQFLSTFLLCLPDERQTYLHHRCTYTHKKPQQIKADSTVGYSSIRQVGHYNLLQQADEVSVYSRRGLSSAVS